MPKLTINKVKRYLHNDGAFCPFCGNEMIEVTEDFDPEGMCRTIWCYACGEYWKEIFQLVGVSHEPEGDIIPKKGD